MQGTSRKPLSNASVYKAAPSEDDDLSESKVSFDKPEAYQSVKYLSLFQIWWLEILAATVTVAAFVAIVVSLMLWAVNHSHDYFSICRWTRWSPFCGNTEGNGCICFDAGNRTVQVVLVSKRTKTSTISSSTIMLREDHGDHYNSSGTWDSDHSSHHLEQSQQ